MSGRSPEGYWKLSRSSWNAIYIEFLQVISCKLGHKANLGFYSDQNENLYMELECGPAQSYLFLLLLLSQAKVKSTPSWARPMIGIIGIGIGIIGRKMRSPPADIFIYGVHPDTSEEDIVNDLAESNIMVEVKEVILKSKPEAFLKSFKISVKAEDLQKAFDPSIWPLRVKVREFIYYSKKSTRPSPGGYVGEQPRGQAGRHQGQQGHTGHHNGQQFGVRNSWQGGQGQGGQGHG